MVVDIDSVVLFSLLFLRVISIIATAPLLGSPSVPARVKVGLALVLTFVFFPLAGRQEELAEWGLTTMALAAGKEVLVGIIVGFVSSLVFAGINLAGQLMGFQMGFAIVNVIDPLNQAQVSIISQFLGFMTLVLFVTLNAHYWFIEAIADSLSIIKFGPPSISGLTVGHIMDAGGNIFLIALKVGAPVFAILLFTQVGLGIVARTVPQMNVFIVGFPLTVGLGLVAVGLTLPPFFEVAKALFGGIRMDLPVLMRGV